ncbi:hypothetical protein [Streptococcus sp. Marseille-Q8145]
MNKLTIQAPDGSNVKTLSPMYSITTLLFNFFVPLFRKDWKYFGIMLGSLFVFAVIATLLIPDDFLRPVGTAYNLFWAFFYNRLWIKDRVFTDGWVPADDASKSLLDKTFSKNA